jgi:putative DNA primase/helicase
MSVTLDQSAPDGFLVHSFAGDDSIACRDHVRALAGLPAWVPSSGDRASMPRPVIVPAQPDEEEERRAAWLQTRVLALWEEARDPRGSIVEAYLASRALVLPDEVAKTVLRFHPACPWKDANGNLLKVPAMIAAMRCIHTNRLKAVHRTRLTLDGKKVDRRMLGDATEVAIKLDPDEAVTMGLVVGEGIETCLAARQIGLRPAWALGSVGMIQTLSVLPGVEAITLLAETDKKGANARAIDTCGTRWHEAGRAVIVASPKFGGDVNDALQGKVA